MKKFPRIRRFLEHTNISFVPILAPGAGGKAMMVPPQVLAAHLFMSATGESHDEDCNCAVCEYRADDSAMVEVHRHREMVAQGFQWGRADHRQTYYQRLREEIRRFQRDDHEGGEEVGQDEAAYWAQRMDEMFGLPDTWETIFRRLDGTPRWRIFEVLINYVLDEGAITRAQKRELWDLYPDLIDIEEGMGALRYLVEQQYVGV